MKSWHVTVMEGFKQIFSKQCLGGAGESKKLFDEMKEKYPPAKKEGDPKYTVYREQY